MKKFIHTIFWVIAIGIIGKLAGMIIGEIITKPGAIKAAQYHIRNIAVQENMPTDLFQVEWASSSKELKKIRPNVISLQPNEFYENILLGQRPVMVTYIFEDDFLVMYIMTYTDPFNQKEFQSISEQLTFHYGTFSPLHSEIIEQSIQTCSSRKSKYFAIKHCLLEIPNLPAREQILFYKRK